MSEKNSHSFLDLPTDSFGSSIEKGSDCFGANVASSAPLTDTVNTDYGQGNNTLSTESDVENTSDEEVFFDTEGNDNISSNGTTLYLVENKSSPDTCPENSQVKDADVCPVDKDDFSPELLKVKDEDCPSFPEPRYCHGELLQTIQEFVDRIGLSEFYPNKMNLLDVMKIDPKTEETTYHDLPWVVMRNLLMANFTSRDNMVDEFIQKISPDQTAFDERQETDDFLMCIDLGVANSTDEINPLDLLLAIFICSSSPLRHILVAKLFMCKLAIPLVVPFNNQCFQLIHSSLHSILLDDISDTEGVRQKNALDCPSHVVSFIRYGRPCVSKSQAINSLLSDTNHNSFFNENCPLGKSEKVISDGMIEISWYIPSGNTSSFRNVTVFMNLRGDCKLHGDKIAFLEKVSDIVIVFVELGELSIPTNFPEFLETFKAKSILAIDVKQHKKCDIKNILKHFSKNDLPKLRVMSIDKRDISKSDVKKKLNKQITSTLANCTPKKLSKLLDVTTCGIVKDEDSPYQKKGKEAANDIIDQLPALTTNVKAVVAPMQGEPLEIWSRNKKIINNSNKFKSLQERSNYEMEMKQQRQKQITMSRNMHPFMKKCLNVLSSSEGEDFVTVVGWLKLLLDERTRASCSKLKLEYQNAINASNKAKEECKQCSKWNCDEIDRLDAIVQERKDELNAAPFKFEHVIRELSQYFECLKSSKEELTQEEVNLMNDLPNIGVKLLLTGQPIEILDGDTTNVPILWVEAVLQQLKNSLGDKKLLALSVVGLQSSGKSTMLNTMFGLQFAVSVGRCTSGVSIQLVPMNKKYFDFDFVVVIDTEGLRAPTKAITGDFSHDNMLATFVIGLGDVAIVNVKGENTSEIKEILQIAVHAFLRLKLANKNLNLKQSCVFVHQNIADADASSKMIEERQLFVQTLDDMAATAAERENIADIETFTEIMEFDSDKNVSYFSDLWHGDPPMAPVNPGYSRRISEVRNNILFQLASQRETYLTITDTLARVKDLWAGILKDDFVYSFRNSLELKAYSEIESQYHQNVWELEKFLHRFVLETAKTALVQVEHVEQSVLDRTITDLGCKFSTEIVNQVKKATENLSNFIDTNKLKDVMMQWKDTKLSRLQILSENLILKCHSEILLLKDETVVEIMQQEKKVKYETEINELARKLACELKGETPSDDVLTARFDSMWKTWIHELNIKSSVRKESVRDQIGNLLVKEYPADFAFMTQFTCQSKEDTLLYYRSLEGSIALDKITNDQISIRKTLSAPKQRHENHREMSLNIINNILRKVDLRLNDLIRQDIRFNTIYIHEIIKIITDAFSAHNSHRDNEYDFNLHSTLRAMVIDHVICYCTEVFTDLDKKYDEKFSLWGRLNDYKRVVWTLFKNLVEQKTEDIIAVGFIREILREFVRCHVGDLIHIPVAERVLTAFSQEKYQVMKGIMIDLANKDKFDDYIAYIDDPASFAREWISNYMHSSLFEEKADGFHLYAIETKKIVQTVFERLFKAVHDSNKRLQHNVADQNNVSSSSWVDTFVDKLSRLDLPISRASFTHISSRSISDLQNFTSVLIEELSHTETELNVVFAETTIKSMCWKQDVMTVIMDRIWGCVDKCMFCKEPCMNTDKEHVKYDIKHHCIQHRPQGIGGYSNIFDQTLAVDFCNFLIQTETKFLNPDSYERTRLEWRYYKEYKKYYPEWDIQPTYDTSKYWMYVLRTYQHQFKRCYHAQLPKIPESWNDITKEDAINCL